MKLKDLIEIQRCYRILRDNENFTGKLSSADYLDCVKAQGVLDGEINSITKTIDIEMEAA